MTLEVENVLRLFIKTAKFDFVALIFRKDDNIKVLTAGNKKISTSKLFLTFKDKFLYELNENISLVDNDELFNTFLSFYNFNQYYIKELFRDDNISAYIFGFSKQVYKNTSMLIKIRADLETILKDYITYDIKISNYKKEEEFIAYYRALAETIEKSDLIFYTLNKQKAFFPFSFNNAAKLFDKDSVDFKNEIEIEQFLKLLFNNDKQLFDSFWEETSKNNSFSTVLKIYSDSGIEKHVLNFAVKIDKEDKIAGIILNIQKEKSLENKLLKLEQINSLINELSDNLIFVLDENGYINYINDYGAITLGYLRDDLIGKHLFEFIPDSGKAETVLAFQKALGSDSRIVFGAKILDRFKNSMDFEFNIKSIKINNNITGLLGVAVDVTDKIKTETQLRELNAKIFELNRLISIEKDRAKHQISLLEELNKMKSDFISNVSHEFRTPLASIIGFAETIDSDRDLAPEMIYDFNRIILEEGKRLAKLINDILDFSKLESGGESLDKQQLNIITIILDVYEMLYKSATKKGITINKQIPEAEITVLCDKERMSKVFFNLISNAIKFTGSGGFITITVQDFLKEVEIIISDTGIGIAKEDIPKLFQKFSKIDRPGNLLPGAGFGLPVVKQIIELHKGLIRVESEVNKGTSFIIRLPKN